MDITRKQSMHSDLDDDAYRSVFKHSMDAVLFTIPDGRILAANPAACRLFRRDEEEIREAGRAGLVDPASPQLSRMLEERARTGTAEGELVFIRGDGSRFVGGISSSVFTDKAGRSRSIMIIHDLSEIKEMEKMIRDRMLELQTILDGSCVAIVFVRDRLQIWANKRMGELFGYTTEEMANQPTSLFYQSQRDYEAFGESAYPALRRGETFHSEQPMRHRDGHILWINLSGKAISPDDLSLGSIWVLEDITSRRQAEEALKASAREIVDLYENAPCGYHSVDADGIIVRINQTELDWLGYGREELLGRNVREIHTPASQPLLEQKFSRLANHEPVRDMEFELVRKDGSILPVLLNATGIRDEDGKFVMSRSTILDLRVRKELERKLEIQAHYDLLTGLNNRAYFCELAERELARTKRMRHPLGFMMFDVDHFKHVNDTYGHDAGDAVLKALATCSLKTLREIDIIGRWGGEEFVVLLPGISGNQVRDAAERLRIALSGIRVEIGKDKLLSISVSIGATWHHDSDPTLDNLVKRADEALYAAKHEGRNCVFLDSSVMS